MKRTIERVLCMALVMALFFVVYAAAEGLDDNLLAEEKMAEDGAITSDIVTGIDQSSIVVEDNATFFTSVMSDGTQVRFEGTDIVVDANGITFNPGSSIVSLDALGKIYQYQITVKDCDQAPIGEQWLDIGYGYTNAADKSSVERAQSVYAGPLFGYPASAWNGEISLGIASIEPNFVFVQGVYGNTEPITVTHLVIGYAPEEKYTDIEFLRTVLPVYFENFESFFENLEPAETLDVVYEEETPIDEYEDPYEMPIEDAPVLEEPVQEEPVQEEQPVVDPIQMLMEENHAIYSDIVAGIDLNSVTVEGGSTFFSSVMSDGTVVRFEGTNTSVTEEGLTLRPESRVTSLDAVGTIYLYQASVKDGESDPVRSQWLDVGGGYTFDPAKLSVERAGEVFANGTYGLSAAEWNGGVTLTMTDYLPNFVFFDASPSNGVEITLTSLVIGYQPEKTYTPIAEVQGDLPDYYYSQAPVNTQDALKIPAQEPAQESAQTIENAESTGTVDAYTLAALKMQESGAVSIDIISAIDLDSAMTDGDSTFFKCVLGDGREVRFEGRNISLSEEGITMDPGSSVTSLDAVGRIYEYSAQIKDKDDESVRGQLLNVGYGYTFRADKTAVAGADEVYTHRISGLFAPEWQSDTRMSVAYYAPNFVYFEAQDYNTDAFTLTNLVIGCDPEASVTALTAAELSRENYGDSMDGEPYHIAREEKADESKREYDFYLMMKTEAMEEAGVEDQDLWLHFLPRAFYEVGDLKDEQGNVLAKDTARVHEGCTLDVTIGDYAFALELPMADRYEGAQTLHDARPYSTLEAVGSQNVLAIPVVWADQRELATDALYAMYQKALGALIDSQGQMVGDHSDAEDEVFSLTEYFDTASYGQLEIRSFMTDWYYTDKTFADDYEYIFPEVEFADEVIEWVKTTYPDLDWTQFDQDGDGVIDAIVFFSVGLTQNEGYTPASFGGAVHSTGNNYGKRAGTQQDPQVNCFLTVGYDLMKDGDTHTLIHEFSHNFGLNDYYDGSGQGIDAVGGYDMESGSVGDWNAYSKLAVGWMNEQVVADLASGESVELSITSSALAGDVILLPAAGTQYDGPFGEYVMIDLLTPDGVNAYDAEQYGLEDTVGVRISHVNANMKKTRESDGVIGDVEDNGSVIGMELFDNNDSDDGLGLYNIEVIQSSGVNTFTNLEKLYPYLSAEDLFYAGDSFAAEHYGEFFHQGLMDNGLPLGYTVTIVDISEDAQGRPTASIRITAD